MLAQTFSHFRILDKLGSGGMGVVYRAEDTALGRTVALKFLPGERAKEPSFLERFKQEARTASALNHPHICTIYEIGEDSGEVYIAMEYVEGQPLRERVGPEGLPVEAVIRFGRQIAAALEHAHEHGVIHRDLKLSNIMATPQGDTKVLDFGLARRVEELDLTVTSLTDASLEKTVGLAGTFPYMAPELLEGKASSPRSDLWALGIVLYEMAAGRRPFSGENFFQLSTAILKQPPPPLPQQIPPGLRAVIHRCLEKEPARRYQRASEVLAALEALSSAAQDSSATLSVAADAPRMPAAGKRERWVRRLTPVWTLAIVLTAVALAIPALRQRVRNWLGHPQFPSQVQLVVLPAAVNAADTETSAFGNGLAETLTSRLGQLSAKHALAVIPASEVRTRHVTSLAEAREEFGVNLGLSLGVERAGQMMRVNYSLVDAATHRQLAGGTVTAAATDPFALEDRVADSVVETLEIHLQPSEKQGLAAHGTSQPAAYDYYLQGRGYLQDFQKLENIESAISVFQQALTLDPNYVLAYAGLGEAYWRKYQSRPEEVWARRALDACERAVQLQDSAAAGHVCLGLVYIGTGKYEQAVGQYRRSIELDPTADAAYSGLASAYEHLNQPAEAESTFQRAIALRPNYWATYNWLGGFYQRHARYADAAKMYAQVVKLAPDSFIGYNNLGIIHLAQGQYAEAIPLLERSLAIRSTGDARSNLAYAYFQTRRYADAARVFEEAVKLDDKSYIAWGNLGDAYYWAPGRRADASPAYRKAIALGEESLRVNPRDAGALASLATYHAMLGEKKPALAALDRALRLAPASPDLLFTAGLVYQQLGDSERALGALEKAVAAGLPVAQLRDAPNFDTLRGNPRFIGILSH